jgi:putative transposase
MQALGRRYVRRFNTRHRRSGTLWEGRYRSTVVQTDRYLLACMRYIDLNPVRAGLVEEASAYRWSSCGHYFGLRVDPVVDEHMVYWALGNTPFERQLAYRKLFETEIPPGELQAIRYATHRGWALGHQDFADRLVAETGRRASPGVRGRPRRAAN